MGGDSAASEELDSVTLLIVLHLEIPSVPEQVLAA